jgi:SP family general alpha glucoside:H+ symporter-like MFS transporter
VYFPGELHAQPRGKLSALYTGYNASQSLTRWSIQGANLGGKCGYVWAGTAFFCLILAYFYVPEMKGRSYREIDILFNRHVPARKWKGTVIDAQDDE